MSKQMELRICTKCNIPKEHSEYYKDSRGSFGLKSWCKVCHGVMGALNRKKKYVPSTRVKLTKEEKRIKRNEYKKRKLGSLSPEELKVVRDKEKAYRDAHKEEAVEYKKIWHAKNKDRLNKKSKEYGKINRPRIKEYLRDYLPRRRELRKERFQTDLLYRVTTNLRTCITRAFKIRQGWGKLGKSEEILGDKYEVVIKHIEDQLHDGMTWENYGAGHGCWNIDHRIPLASAKTVEEVKALCHYSNLQPLWFIDNVRKQAKMPEEWEAMKK